jgi:hypothetical protein
MLVNSVPPLGCNHPRRPRCETCDRLSAHLTRSPTTSVGLGHPAAPFWLPCAQSTLSTTSAPHLKILFMVDAPHFLVVHLKTFSGDHHVNTAATKPTPFTRHAFDCIHCPAGDFAAICREGRSSTSSPRRDRYRTVDRPICCTSHARRWLTPCASHK